MIYGTKDKNFHIVCIEFVSSTWFSRTSLTNIYNNEYALQLGECSFFMILWCFVAKKLHTMMNISSIMKHIWCSSFPNPFFYIVESFILHYFVCVFLSFFAFLVNLGSWRVLDFKKWNCVHIYIWSWRNIIGKPYIFKLIPIIFRDATTSYFQDIWSFPHI